MEQKYSVSIPLRTSHHACKMFATKLYNLIDAKVLHGGRQALTPKYVFCLAHEGQALYASQSTKISKHGKKFKIQAKYKDARI